MKFWCKNTKKIKNPQIFFLKMSENPQFFFLKMLENPQIFFPKMLENPQIFTASGRRWGWMSLPIGKSGRNEQTARPEHRFSDVRALLTVF